MATKPHAGRTHGLRTGKNARSGPPSPEERLTCKRVSYRIHPTAIAALEALAARWGVSRSRALTRVLLAAASTPEPTSGDPTPEPPPGDPTP
jgi:hypothetical protein